MPTRRRAAAALLVAVAVLGAGACDSGSDSDSTGASASTTTTNPGPNPTPAVDPGPKDTSSGPFTFEGIVRLPSGPDCIQLTAGDRAFDLRFDDDYRRMRVGGRAAVVNPDGTAVAHDGDSMIVAGFPRAQRTKCGAVFDVRSLVTAVPADATR